MDKYTLVVKPIKSNKYATFTIWDNRSGEKHSEDTVELKTPESIGFYSRLYNSKMKELNKPDYALLQNPYAKAEIENYE
jgi:hypothetical protein